MTEPPTPFANLMQRVLAGEDEAAQELYTLYGHHILQAVRSRLHHRLRSKFDSLDFVQDVWASFFTDVPEKTAFDSPKDLVAFLTTMARNKVSETFRTRMQRQKYNVNRETPLDNLPSGADRFPSTQRTPSEIIMEGEEWEQFLEKQPLAYRRILLLLREGKDSATIAQEVGLSQRTINRIIRRYSGEDPT